MSISFDLLGTNAGLELDKGNTGNKTRITLRFFVQQVKAVGKSQDGYIVYIVSNVEEEITGFFASADLQTCKDVVSIISLLAVVVIIRTKLLTQMQT